MTRGVPVLDPAVHLKGATPETLAKALFRRTEPLRSARVRKPVVGDELAVEKRARRKPVIGDQVAVEEAPADEPGDGITHLDESV